MSKNRNNKSNTKGIAKTVEVMGQTLSPEQKIKLRKSITENEEITWDGLVELRKNAAIAVLTMQQKLTDLSIQFESKINADTELFDHVRGLGLTINDLAEEISKTTKRHAKVKQDKDGNIVAIDFKTGICNPDKDEDLEYLNIANEYITVQESLANISAQGFIDILTKLGIEENIVNDIKTANEQGKKELEKVVKGK